MCKYPFSAAEEVASLNNSDEEMPAVPAPSKQKPAKKSKKKRGDDDDDIADELEALTLEMTNPEAAKNSINGAVKNSEEKVTFFKMYYSILMFIILILCWHVNL